MHRLAGAKIHQLCMQKGSRCGGTLAIAPSMILSSACAALGPRISPFTGRLGSIYTLVGRAPT